MTKKSLSVFLEDFIVATLDDFALRVNRYTADLYEPEVHEVTLGLLARQCSLAIELAQSPLTWNQHSAPLFHRAMSDAYITLAYILQANTKERAHDFILFGLGQEKLAIAHREAALREEGKTPDEDVQLKARKNWLDSQRLEFLTTVNIGSATGKSTRQMAEESGNLSLYNNNYTPFSAAVHSTWQHIARFNLLPCTNPLHGLHRVPAVELLEIDIFELWIASKNLHKAFTLIDKTCIGKTLPVKNYQLLSRFLADTPEKPKHAKK